MTEILAQTPLSSLRQPPGFWEHPGKLEQLVSEIEALADDGLEPRRYQLDQLRFLATKRASGTELDPCDHDLASHAYLQALWELAFGRIDPQRAGLIWYQSEDTVLQRQQVLAHLAATGATDITASFDQARPDFARYRNLRAAYRQARKTLPATWIFIPSGQSLRPGDVGERIPLVRQRLQAEGFEPVSPGASVVPGASVETDPHRYDEPLVAAVKAFQHRHGLEGDGVIGAKTLAEMNQPPGKRLAQIRANLERMRWLGRDMAPEILLVDIAGAKVEYYRQGQLVWAERVQVGRAERATPSLKSTITHVTLNPPWTVPPTIYKKDKLPEIRKDIGYLARNRIRVLDREGRQLNPAGIDWYNPGNIVLRQDPGAKSALGLVALRFPNPYAVYLHDTPSQKLFDSHDRFYSSGCVRVRNAMALTEMLFDRANPEEKAAFQEILASGKTRNINLPVPVALVMAYWTAEAGENGEIFYRPDSYGLDNYSLDGALDDSLTRKSR